MIHTYRFLYVCPPSLQSCLDSAMPWTEVCQASLSMGFSWQECWSGLPGPPPGDLPDPGVELMFPASADGFCTAEPPRKPPHHISISICIYISASNLGVHVSFQICGGFFWIIYPGVELLCHMVVQFFML